MHNTNYRRIWSQNLLTARQRRRRRRKSKTKRQTHNIIVIKLLFILAFCVSTFFIFFFLCRTFTLQLFKMSYRRQWNGIRYHCVLILFIVIWFLARKYFPRKTHHYKNDWKRIKWIKNFNFDVNKMWIEISFHTFIRYSREKLKCL